jgi:hypothetical protein
MQNNVPLDIVRQVYLYDQERVNRGGNPMSDREAAVAILGAQGKGGESGRVGGFLENAASDLRDIVLGLPQLPGFILKEPAEMGDPETGLGPSVSAGLEAMSAGDFGKGIAKIAGAPGIRLVPGSFTAEMLGGGYEGDKGPGELAKHPLFTFLDLLPVASKAGLTDAALSRLTGSSPWKRAAQNLENRGWGRSATGTAREFRKGQRLAEEGVLGEASLGRSGVGTHAELQEHVLNWLDTFDDAELTATWDYLEQGRWKSGDAPPKWATDSGRGDAWTSMVEDAKAMVDWYGRHGVKGGEVLSVNGELYPNTPAVRKVLKEIQEAKSGKKKTGKSAESTEAKRVRAETVVAETTAKIAELESTLAVVDAVRFSDEITDAVTSTERLSMVELGQADDLAAAEAVLKTDSDAAARLAPSKSSVVEETAWPDDVPALRTGESKYVAGERSPAFEGESVVTKRAGRAPSTEEGRLLQVRQKLDGEVVAERAAEVVDRRVRAQEHLNRVVALRRLTPAQSRNVKAAADGRLHPGSLEDRVRALNDQLGDAAANLDETITVPRLDRLGREVDVEMTRLAYEVDELKVQGWEDKVVDGKPFSSQPSKTRVAKMARRSLKKREASLLAAAEESGAFRVGTPEAAEAVRVRIKITLEDDIADLLDRHITDEATIRVAKGHDPSDYRIDPVSGRTRPGDSYPTRLTSREKDTIRTGRGSSRVVDDNGNVWEVYEFDPTLESSWGARRDLSEDAPAVTGEEVHGNTAFRNFSDEALDKLAAIDDWTELDAAQFVDSERAGLTAEAADQMVDDLLGAATLDAAEAFVMVEGRPVSVAALRVLDRAAEILPDRLARGVSRSPEWEPIRQLAGGDFVKPGVSIVESSSDQAGRLAETAAQLARIDEHIAALESGAKAASVPADEVLQAELALRRATELESQLQSRIEAVKAGEAQAGLREVKETLKAHPDEAELRNLYDQLDAIDSQGTSHPLFSVRDELDAAAAALEDAGIRVKPSPSKSKALLGTRKTRVVTDPGDPGGYRVAMSRRKSSGQKVDSARKRKARIDVAFSNLKAAMIGTVDSPGPLRKAEVAARTGDYTTARQQIRLARNKLDSKTMQEVRRLAEDKSPELAAALNRIESRIDAVYADMPTNQALRTAENSLAGARLRLAKAAKAVTANTADEVRLAEKITSEMSEADIAVTKWTNSVRNLPARLQPMYNRVLSSLLAKRLSGPAVSDNATRKLTFGKYREAAKAAGIPDKEFRLLEREAFETVAALRAAGYEPVWLPHRQVGNRGRAPGKLFGQKIVTPQAFKQRYLNPEPYIRNLAVALEQNSADFIRRTATEALYFGDEAAGLDGLFNMYGKTWDDLMDMYSDEIAAQRVKQPHVPPENIAQRVIRKDWATVNPQKWGLSEKWAPQSKIKYHRRGLGVDPEDALVSIDNIYMPRGVSATVEGMQKTGGLMPFRNTYDQVMDVFRVSALALSPRFLVYNAIGGMAMLMGRTDPTVLMQLQRAKKLVDDGELPPGISMGAAMVDPDLTKAFTQDISRLATDKRTGFMWGIGEGRWLGETFRNVQRAANKSFQINEWFDNVYRAMAYLHESDKALARGATAAEATEAGVKLANKILQDWDAMLPWERTIMRRVFPFYGWMKHVLKYTFTLPYDHPMRVSILTNFAANEMEDYRTGIPQWMASTFFIGKEGPDTKQWAVNMRSANPWADVARYADFDSREYGSGVVLGFLTQMSPIASSVMESMGVSPMSGRARLYPEMSYDPETGRLRSTAPSILHTLPKSIVPQVEGVAGLVELAGVRSGSRELRNMRVNNPDAFVARIWSSFGLPFAPRKRSRTFELQRSALAREQAAGDAVNRALRTGDWGDALGYEQARIRGQVFKVDNLYALAKRNPELLEVILSASGR